jgi:hypothetical protein
MSVIFNSTTPAAASGQTQITWQKDGSGNVSGEVGPGLPIDIAAFAPGLGTNVQILLRLKLNRGIKFPASATLSNATASANCTGNTTYTLKKNGSAFATVLFTAGGATGAWTQASDSTFVATDLLEIDGPAVADATLKDVGITLAGLRT